MPVRMPHRWEGLGGGKDLKSSIGVHTRLDSPERLCVRISGREWELLWFVNRSARFLGFIYRGASWQRHRQYTCVFTQYTSSRHNNNILGLDIVYIYKIYMRVRTYRCIFFHHLYARGVILYGTSTSSPAAILKAITKAPLHVCGVVCIRFTIYIYIVTEQSAWACVSVSLLRFPTLFLTHVSHAARQILHARPYTHTHTHTDTNNTSIYYVHICTRAFSVNRPLNPFCSTTVPLPVIIPPTTLPPVVLRPYTKPDAGRETTFM